MKRISKKISVLLALVMVISQIQGVFATEGPDPETEDRQVTDEVIMELIRDRDYAEGELIVSYDGDLSDRKIEKNAEKMDADVKEIMDDTSGDKVARVAFSEGESMEDALKKFILDDTSIEVQPNYIYDTQDMEVSMSGNDPGKGRQSFLDLLDVENAWNSVESRQGRGRTKVFIIDTGVTSNHEDLQRTYGGKKYTGFSQGTRINGLSYENGSHGTMVSGIMAADYNNSRGGTGIASGHNNDLVDLNVVGASFNGMEFMTMDVLNAMNEAVTGGAGVINMSFGVEGHDRLVENAVKNAYDRGIVLVAASGNKATDEYYCPAGMKEVISVNWADHQSGKWVINSSSNYGKHSDISAPGSNIYTTSPEGYSTGSGTSFSAPMVSGIAAMMLDVHTDLTPAQVYNIICASTGAAFDNRLGYGVINAYKCVENAFNASGSIAPTDLLVKTGSDLTVEAGEIESLETLIRPATSLADVSFVSSNDSVASVDKIGRVTGNSPGNCTVKVRTAGIEKTVNVKVTGTVPVTGISISKDTRPLNNEMAVGQYLDLDIIISPENVSNKEVYFKSSDNDIATCDETGRIIAKKTGKVTITAYAFVKPAEGTISGTSAQAVSDSITINVKKMATRLNITRKRSWIKVGSKYTFKAKALDSSKGSNVAHSDIYWDVSDTTIATIDSKGVLRPKKSGTVYVYAGYLPALPSLDEKDHSIIRYTKVIIAKMKYSGKKDYKLRVKGKLKKKVLLQWKKNPIASGYEIQACGKKNGKYRKIKTIKKGNTVKATIKTKKIRYYRVRAYYYENGKKKYFGFSNKVKGTLRR